MSKPLLCKKKAKIISFALFIIGLVLLTIAGQWWPGIMLVIGIPLAVRQKILARNYDMWVTLFVFIGAFITVQFNISWEILLPILFTLGGIYLLFREYIESTEESEEEREEDLNEEIEEKQQEKHK